MNILKWSFLLLLFLVPPLLMAQKDNSRYYYLLVGTYTSGKSEGIYLYRFDTKTGELVHKHTATGVANPSFLALSPDGKFLYSVNEAATGNVSAFHFDKKAARLEHINRQASKGGAPCYLTANGKHLFTGNYSGGNLSVFQIQKDGSLGAAIQTITHEGSSVNKQRQEKPHVHSTVLSPEGKDLFVCDLGTDKIYTYTYKPNDQLGLLQPANPPSTAVAPGSGPRHLVFDTAGKFAYVVYELTAEVGVFKYENGMLSHLQTIPMTAEDFKGELGAAEVRISPDGKFLYASNRGDANDIVIYAIDQKKGTLSYVDRQSTLGKTPRNFIIDPTGNYLLVANQNSDNIIVFTRNKRTGKLYPSGTEVEVGNPVYLLMAEH